jgi:hypothetical protein
MRIPKFRTIFGRIFALAAPWILYGFRQSMAEDPNLLVGRSAFGYTVLGIIVALLVITIALSVGGLILRGFRKSSLSSIDSLLIAVSLGLAGIGYAMLALGLLGILTPVAVVLTLSMLSFAGGLEFQKFIRGMPKLLQEARVSYSSSGRWTKIVVWLSVAIFSVAFIDALAPPYDYDGLMYHLQGPKTFLNANRIFPDMDNWWNNYPFTIQMVFITGLAYDADFAAKLINLAYGAILIGAVARLSRLLLPKAEPWIAVAAMLAIPAFPRWFSFAYIDVAWAAYVVLSVWCIFKWQRSSDQTQLIMGGLFAGLALASKYVGVLDFGLLLGLLVYVGWAMGPRYLLRTVFLFSIIAAFVAFPWYLKNLVWLGSPIFPIELLEENPAQLRLDLNRAYVQSGLGMGRSITDYIRLPYRLYFNSIMFGQTSLEMPSLLFPLLILWPLAGGAAPVVILIAGLIRFVLWAGSSQQMSFLLPAFAFFSVAVGYLIHAISSRSNWRIGFALRAFTIGMVTLTLVALLSHVFRSESYKVGVGSRSRDEFLTRTLEGYRARKFIKDHLAQDERVFLVGDGRRYYCPQQCVAEVDQFAWTRIALEGNMSTEAAATSLYADGITHMLLSWPDINYLVQHDADGRVAESMEFLLSEFEPACLRAVFDEEHATLYELTCFIDRLS